MTAFIYLFFLRSIFLRESATVHYLFTQGNDNEHQTQNNNDNKLNYVSVWTFCLNRESTNDESETFLNFVNVCVCVCVCIFCINHKMFIFFSCVHYLINKIQKTVLFVVSWLQIRHIILFIHVTFVIDITKFKVIVDAVAHSFIHSSIHSFQSIVILWNIRFVFSVYWNLSVIFGQFCSRYFFVYFHLFTMVQCLLAANFKFFHSNSQIN